MQTNERQQTAAKPLKQKTMNKKQPTQADCAYIKNGVIYSSYNGKKIGRLSK